MSRLGKVGDLEIAQDLTFQRRQWLVQRVVWVCMALALLGALAGLMGHGPLSKTSAATADGALEVHYERFLRHGGRADLAITVSPGAGQSDVTLWLDAEYQRAMEITNVTPLPTSVEADSDRYVYRFRLVSPERPAVIAFRMVPQGYGTHPARLGLVGRQSLEFWQFVYP